MAKLAHHPVTWQAPRPLWRGATPYAAAPQILRFAQDDFMEQMLATLAEDPAALARRIARPETWRTPVGEDAAADLIQRVPLPAALAATKRRRLFGTSRPVAPPPPPVDGPLKLFQPAHQRHYLVAGTLACALPGLPERQLEGEQETVHMVIRRLLPGTGATGDTTLREFAYVQDGDEARWRKVAEGEEAAALAPGEELLPLFRLAHHDEDGRPRALWAGVVPVGRREAYLGVSVDRTVATLTQGQVQALRPGAAPQPRPSVMGRLTQFRMTVAEPWKAIVRSAIKLSPESGDPPATEGTAAFARAKRRLSVNLQFQMQSWLILADFYEFLEEHMAPVADAIKARSGAGLTGGAATLFTRLADFNADALTKAMRDPANQTATAGDLKTMAANLREALALVSSKAVRDALEAKTTHYAYAGAMAREAGWPSFHFPLAGVNDLGQAAGPYTFAAALPAAAQGEADAQPAVTTPPAIGPNDPAEELDRLTALVGRALAADAEPKARPLPYAMKLRDSIVATAGDAGLFVIRFVHLNRDCGPLHPPTLSAPTERFRMASFFDPDAPVRPIRITLPADTSPAGLRKHGRGTAFVLSDMLCGQVQRAKSLGFIDLVLQVLPWPFHKDIDIGDGGACKRGDAEIGMICSLSIPIITLCALILLIIIITLLDFIFRWVPWFIACFPVPGLKGKSG